jgi:hypothetical protein
MYYKKKGGRRNMSFPNIPNVSPDINLGRQDAINLLLVSIAFEELGLAHIINAEAEKIQCVLGTLPGQRCSRAKLEDILAIDESVDKTLKDVIKSEMLLQFKLEQIIDLISTMPPNVFKNTAEAEGFYNNEAYTDTAVAYYNTGTSTGCKNNYKSIKR